MKTIIKNWCETNTINVSDAPKILSEFARLTNREMTSEHIHKILIVQSTFPVDWEYILRIIAVKSEFQLEILTDQHGHIIKRYFIE